MSADLLIGVDAGTSVIKAVAFTLGGAQVAVAGRPNAYRTLANGGVEQNLEQTWRDTVGVLSDLGREVPDLGRRAAALAITGQGDGTWLIDEDGAPVADGWLWLDGRAGGIARAIGARADYRRIYETTATGVNPCQQHVQLAWMKRHAPEVLARARTAFHCKDWLYYRLTGERVTDPSEGTFTFGNFRTRAYAPELLEAFGIVDLGHLLPPMVDGAVRAHPLAREVAAGVGLPAGLPVVLGYVDVICSALGGGVYDASGATGLTILGSTGMHMRLAATPGEVHLNDAGSGYTMPFPDRQSIAQMQSNMAATLNIDWMLDLAREVLAVEGVQRSRHDLLANLDDRILGEAPGRALYHPYISIAGERGPFMEPAARAGFAGLHAGVGFYGLMRTVYEGLAMAARDCYLAMGPIPKEIRVTGGAARSRALRAILSATLDSRLRASERGETGAAGAVMMAAVQIGAYPDLAACAAEWVDPYLGPPEVPDATVAAHYQRLFPVYRRTRELMVPVWHDLAAATAETGT